MSEKIATKKTKKEKNNGFKVPPKKGGSNSSPWPRHVFDMIKEANPQLLDREDVKIAYNNFVDCLQKYEPENLYTNGGPGKHYKYSFGIKPSPNSVNNGLPVFIRRDCYNYYSYDELTTERNRKIHEKEKVIYNYVIDTYKVLYELIKRDVVHHMEREHHKVVYKNTIDGNHKRIAQLEKEIAEYRELIDNAYKEISDCAKECVDIEAGPTLTKFD